MNINFYVPCEDMVRGARSGSSSARRSSRGRGLFAASAFGPSSVPPPLAAGSSEFTPPPPRVPGPSVSAPPAFLAGASTVPEEEDAVSYGRCG
ncbi:hypothetical protein Taro_048500 [Colocasia esculenta]|uniref:Uncharacterized protein n=1 Tax=Colocasia esculenta TaxID=4460 RepID=A0A843X8A8_COLES|nr:hypothetical protein [Colocasia esculenta]